MENKIFIEDMNKMFGNIILDTTEHNSKRLTFAIKPEALEKVTEFFYQENKFRFIIASGLHTKKGFEILYHFSNDLSGHVVNLHVILPNDNPEINSLTGIFSAANWIEREIHELLGINFKGHPDLQPLISKDNWPEGTYPYRKDFIL
jgi:NADH-quinone oxidoreductase subunit C